MTDPDPGNLAAQSRERHDPEEKYRPLPWFISMLISAMAMWGAFYIHDMQSGLSSQYGDSRTRSALMHSYLKAGVARVKGDTTAAPRAVSGSAEG